MSKHVPAPRIPLAIGLGLAFASSACFVDGVAFDPELCPEFVIELHPGASAIVIDVDSTNFAHCLPDFTVSTQLPAKAPSSGASP